MQPQPGQDVPGLDGPDYVALVIEWNDSADDTAPLISPEISQEFDTEPAGRIGTIRTIAAVVGALGALMLAAWGIRRLRAA